MTEPVLAVFGAGGFLLQMLPTLDRLRDAGRAIFIVDDRSLGLVFGYPVVRLDAVPSNAAFVVAVSDGRTRRQIVERLGGCRFWRATASSALISPYAEIGEGAIICDYTIVEASCRIGRHFQGNIHSYVAHECVIGDYVTFAPRVSCNGNVQIGDHVTIGTGALLRQGTPKRPLIIGAGAIIQMGAVVTRDVEPSAVIKANMRH